MNACVCMHEDNIKKLGDCVSWLVFDWSCSPPTSVWTKFTCWYIYMFTFMTSASSSMHSVINVRCMQEYGSTNITTNNTEIPITDIGEDAVGGLLSLICHTDLTACCRSHAENNGNGGLGQWGRILMGV